jgi:hypothetical protein
MNKLQPQDRLIILACVICSLFIFGVIDDQEFIIRVMLGIIVLISIFTTMWILFGDRVNRKKIR